MSICEGQGISTAFFFHLTIRVSYRFIARINRFLARKSNIFLDNFCIIIIT